ncbi:hypothetical protein DdX_12014 [Ditylenchus destructor]|uniref:Uncharacterized protein n=1 Tax=Ditylenchus destructor TaxID=166010 RepID=A0AAD4QXM9_9BILA|nr:hypothetical protein DdX_12014 [Ditylenchus destructor]
MSDWPSQSTWLGRVLEFSDVHVIRPICWIVSTCLLSLLAYSVVYRPQAVLLQYNMLACAMKLFLGVHLLHSAVFIISQIMTDLVLSKYANLPGVYYDVWWSYWASTYMLVAPVAIFFLTLDRFLALRMGIRYNSKIKKVISRLDIIMLIALFAFSFVNVILDYPDYFPAPPIMNRILDAMHHSLKITFGIVNLIMNCVFFYQLRQTKLTFLRDRIVKISIICDFFFEVIPALSSVYTHIFSTYTEIGNHLLLLTSINAAICSIYYTWAMFARFRRPSVKQALVSNHCSLVIVQSVQRRNSFQPGITAS